MTTSSNATSAIAQCICRAGFTGNYDSNWVASTTASSGCYPCVDGTYKGAAGNATCTVCPTNTFTVNNGAEHVHQCLCNPGFDGPSAGPCSQCSASKYKASVGLNHCVDCPAASESPIGSQDQDACLCKVGFFKHDDKCMPCGFGTYKDAVGSAACTACPKGTNSSQKASVQVQQCLCLPGTTGVGGANGTCTACRAGKFKNNLVAAACTDCPAFSNHTETGATSAQSCLCNAGRNGANGGACVKCQIGSYKDFPGQHGNGSAESCPRCSDQNSNSGSASDQASDCICNAGYSRANGGCTACSAGKYKKEGLMASDPTKCPHPVPSDHTPSNLCPGISHEGLCCTGPPEKPWCVSCVLECMCGGLGGLCLLEQSYTAALPRHVQSVAVCIAVCVALCCKTSASPSSHKVLHFLVTCFFAG